MTEEGKIIVDGVLASCYADIDHDMSYFTTILMQRFPAAIQWVFGEDNGFPVYISTLSQMGMVLFPKEHYMNYQLN